MKRRWPWIVAALLLVLGALAWFFLRPQTPTSTAPRYLTQAVDRGDIRRTVNATGTLSPVNLVQVGSTVSGTIRKLHVDFNSAVKQGQMLAELDTTALDADLAQAEAQRRSAQSSLALAGTRLERARNLFGQGYVARSEVDEAEAGERNAAASLQQMQAGVQRAANNRRNAEIRSPVAGIVVSREVSVGQSVAASLQTPVLFKIAQDLREVQIEMNVSEADVGLMREGLPVRFTVDAFPDRVYEGAVQQVRNNHQVQQNVVTYTVVVRSRNDDLSLRPGMTGYVAVTVAEARATLRIPNAALRFEPAAAASAPAVTERGPANRRVVWKLGAGGTAERVEVTLGIADSRHTQLVQGNLREGDTLVIGEPAKGGFSGPRIF
jgi:HlyD family secretion protein